MDDERIIELFFQRSEHAIDELSKKYGAVSMHTACNIVGNREDAEECVNDAYLGVWNAVPPKRPNPLLAFLLRVVRNISINRYTYNNRQKRSDPYAECVEELSYCLTSGETVEAHMDAKELTRQIEAFLDSLSQTNRMLFVRRYWYVDSYASLSAATGLRENTIRTRLTRMRTDLKKYLQERGIFI